MSPVIPTLVLRPRLQLKKIKALAATHKELKLLRPEERKRRALTHFEEAALEGGELPVDGTFQEVLGVEPDILVAVGVCDSNLPSTFDQVDLWQVVAVTQEAISVCVDTCECIYVWF